jgi:TrmH family RNA methyltransferase
VAQSLSAHNARVKYARELRTRRGRDASGAFAFEGATLLEEAERSAMTPSALYVTQRAYDAHERVRELDARGVPTYVLDDRAFASISDVESPSGILAVAPIRTASVAEIAARPACILVLAGIADPGNVGTLLRSAEAFGCAGAIFSDGGADPYHPKVVRAAMGSVFRLPMATAAPDESAAALRAAGRTVVGLAAGSADLSGLWPPENLALVVGQERHGLGPWEPLCDRLAAIAMPGVAESLNAAVAGSIALYEASRRRPA